MLILGIETSMREKGGVAIAGERGIEGEVELTGGMSYAEKLCVSIERLLKERGIGFKDIAAIAVSTGPGSFTGTRVGVVTAQGLAMVRGLKVIPVNTLESIAFAAGRVDIPVGPVLSAGPERVFGGLYRWEGAIPCELFPPGPFTTDEYFSHLKAPVVLTGPAAGDLEREAVARLGAGVRLAPPESRLPTAGLVAELGLRLFREKRWVDPQLLKPLYTRAPATRVSQRKLLVEE